MIKKPNELDFSGKKISMLITGRPGVGKTTLAESAPNPLLIDLENGVDRVDAAYRGDTMTTEEGITDAQKYESFIYDLTHENLSAYDTIIIDSLGKFIELATPVVIKENSANSQKDGKTLSLKGYGAVSAKVSDFIKLVKSLNKHIIFIAHVSETMDGDVIKTRVNIPGSTKDKIWDDIDVGGYLTYLGKKRVICFTPTEQYDAKGTHGITGTYDIPELKSTSSGGVGADNHFLKDLFGAIVGNITNAQKIYEEMRTVYKEDIKFVDTVKKATNLDELNAVVNEIKSREFALSAKRELLSHCEAKAKELNAKYDKEQGKYIEIGKENN